MQLSYRANWREVAQRIVRIGENTCPRTPVLVYRGRVTRREEAKSIRSVP